MPSARSSRATLLALLADLVWYVFVGIRLGRSCWFRVLTMNASGLLNFRGCYALSLEGNSQVGIVFTCASSEGRIMPCCAIVARLPTSACASRHAPCMCTLLDLFYNHLSSSVVPVNNHFISVSTARGRCHLAFGRWGRLVGLLYGCTERHPFGCTSNL